MKWDLFYVVIIAYRKKLISRPEFISFWKTAQSIAVKEEIFG